MSLPGPVRIITVEPIDVPAPAPTPSPEPVKEPEEVPA